MSCSLIFRALARATQRPRRVSCLVELTGVGVLSYCQCQAQGSRKGLKGKRFETAAVPATVTGERSSMMPLGGCLGRRTSAK